ncbi:hypothetical protein SESBI_27885 [Sesbania bispinosa]|nr:hypothetical protein SESBI_27885 [Sesbania bispinosa]
MGSTTGSSNLFLDSSCNNLVNTLIRHQDLSSWLNSLEVVEGCTILIGTTIGSSKSSKSSSVRLPKIAFVFL